MDEVGERQPSAKPSRQRRIVQRARLLAMIRAAGQRTVLVIGPPGYGKTILAHQWLETEGGGWVGITNASADIPVFARDLGSALADITKFDVGRIETALSAGKTATDQARAVARTVLAQIQTPLDRWIVIDDYHLLMTSPAAEELVESLQANGNLKLIITSRERPSWATSRKRLYFEALDIGMSDLALDDVEVAELLPADPRSLNLRRQARGWPAVIALAAHSEAAGVPLSTDVISDKLYDYVAEELFGGASLDVQRSLTGLVVLPPLPLTELRGLVDLQHIADQLTMTGLAYRSDDRLEVHPLARAFLVTKLRTREDAAGVIQASLDRALDEGLFDHAFELIREFGCDQSLERLISESYTPLIVTGRIATLEEFARYASRHGSVPQHVLDLVSGETALNEGSFDQALSLACSFLASVAPPHPLRPRAYLVAGRAAHLSWQIDKSFEFHSDASQCAVSIRDTNDAAWGRCLAAMYLESDDVDVIREMSRLEHPRPTDRLRLACLRLNYIHLTGDGRLGGQYPEAWQLASNITDPWVRTSWRYTFGHALLLEARYEETVTLMRSTLEELAEYGLSFGLPHVEWTLAAAELGLRHFSRSESLLRRVQLRQAGRRDVYFELNSRALGARLHLAQQQRREAVELTRDDYAAFPSRSMYGEYLSTRALALAVSGNQEEARVAARRARALTHAIDSAILCAAALAIVEAQAEPAKTDAVDELLRIAMQVNTWDGVVCAVRAYPPLLERLVARPEHHAQLRDVLVRSRDVALAKAAGLVTRATGSQGLLSSREREILDQVRQGRKNVEIATSLFIAPGTVKSHLDHIFDKLGVRSRTGAVLRYAEIENAGSGDVSGLAES